MHGIKLCQAILLILIGIATVCFLRRGIQRRREGQRLLMHAEMLQAARQMYETANRYAQEDPVVYYQSEHSQP